MKTFAQKSKFLLDTNIFPLCNGLYSHDTWSRYVTIVTWLLSQITWVRDTKFRGALLPGPGMPHCSEKTHEMNEEFSKSSSNLLFQFVQGTTSLQMTNSHSLRVTFIRKGGSKYKAQWCTYVVSSMETLSVVIIGRVCHCILTIWQPSSCQEAHSFQSDWQIWVKFLLLAWRVIGEEICCWWKYWHFLLFLQSPSSRFINYFLPLPLSKLQRRQEIRNCSNELCGCIQILSVWFPYFHSNGFTSGQ